MRKLIAVAALGALVALPQMASAADTASHTVTCNVPVTALVAVGDNVDIDLPAVTTAGDSMQGLSGTGTSALSWTFSAADGATKKVTAYLSVDAVPADTSLKVTVVGGETDVELKGTTAASAADVVTAARTGIGDGSVITYTFSVTGDVVVPAQDYVSTVVYTVADGA